MEWCPCLAYQPSRHSFCGSLLQSVLSWLQSLLFSFSFMCPALLVRHVRFGFSSDELCITPRVFVYLLNLCKFYIWQSRNNFRFRNIPPGAVDVIAKVKARLKCHLQAFPIFPLSRLLPPSVGRPWCRRFRKWQCSVDCSLACFSAAPCFVLFFVCVPPLG